MKKLCAVFACFIAVMLLSPVPGYADMGPKPSVVVEIEGLEGQDYYITLLSKEKSTGPHSFSDEEISAESYLVGDDREQGMAAWKAFREYKDADGFYFIEYFAKINAEQNFKWGYFPPQDFKILIYLPESGQFAVSGIQSRYAFDSYFTATVSGLDATGDLPIAATAQGTPISAKRNYNYTLEIETFAARVCATIAIELLVALLFRLRKRNILLFIAVVNIITQTLLNVLLNVGVGFYGVRLSVPGYLGAEFLVFAVEAAAYMVYFKKPEGTKPIKKWVAPVYSLTANAVSFVVGILLAVAVPGIF